MRVPTWTICLPIRSGVREMIEETGADLRLLPPYSPISTPSSNAMLQGDTPTMSIKAQVAQGRQGINGNPTVSFK